MRITLPAPGFCWRIAWREKPVPTFSHDALGSVDIQDSHGGKFVIQVAGWAGGQHGWIDKN
jgi:hypothetical protein